jgi:hypothetical protein
MLYCSDMQGTWPEGAWKMLALDMLHLHSGVNQRFVRDPDSLETPEELQQLANDAAQVVAQKAADMMQHWYQTLQLEGILEGCQGVAMTFLHVFWYTDGFLLSSVTNYWSTLLRD